MQLIEAASAYNECLCEFVLDIDECSTQQEPCGTVEAVVACNNTNGSYICECATGYSFANGTCQGNT